MFKKKKFKKKLLKLKKTKNSLFLVYMLYDRFQRLLLFICINLKILLKFVRKHFLRRFISVQQKKSATNTFTQYVN